MNFSSVIFRLLVQLDFVAMTNEAKGEDSMLKLFA